MNKSLAFGIIFAFLVGYTVWEFDLLNMSSKQPQNNKIEKIVFQKRSSEKVKKNYPEIAKQSITEFGKYFVNEFKLETPQSKAFLAERFKEQNSELSLRKDRIRQKKQVYKEHNSTPTLNSSVDKESANPQHNQSLAKKINTSPNFNKISLGQSSKKQKKTPTPPVFNKSLAKQAKVIQNKSVDLLPKGSVQKGNALSAEKQNNVNYISMEITYDEEPKEQKMYEAYMPQKMLVYIGEPSRVKIKTKEDIAIADKLIKAYSELSGYVKLNKDRLEVTFSTYVDQKTLIKISPLEVYDLDGIKGIKIDLNKVQDVIKQKTNNQKVVGDALDQIINDRTQGILQTDRKVEQAIRIPYNIPKGKRVFLRVKTVVNE